MSSKRGAGRELNHDNWNEEEESEEAGEFRKASNEELQRRVRKVAKRRINAEEGKLNPFSAFGGFNATSSSGITASTPATSSPFSFLAKIPSTAPKTNGTSSGIKMSESTSTSISNKSDTSNSDEYYSKIKALNQSFVAWIKTNVDECPLVNLTPTFKDYEKYFKDFESLKNKKPSAIEDKTKESEKPSTSSFSFDKPATPVNSLTPPSSTAPTPSVFNSFKFGSGSSEVKTTPVQPETKTFSFGLPKPSSSTPSLFGGINSSASAPTFSFGNVAPPPRSDAPTESTGDDADEEPPKNEFVPVVEDDSLYTKRCKVFVKTTNDYSDRGIGTLYLKKVEDSKVQLIVRADTNLGNILMNILLVDGLPVSRLGKNNVMIVCLPTPESKPPPTPVLLRVKTSEEADELLETINKHKK